MNKRIKTIFGLAALFNLFVFFSPQNVFAQSINLSVTPPLTEIVIAPGKSIKQKLTITNSGSLLTVNPKIFFFYPIDENGNVEIDTQREIPSWIKYDTTGFDLPGNTSREIEYSIAPPSDTNEEDYFLTFVFETTEGKDLLGQSQVSYKTKIASNILVSISKDGVINKDLKIDSFTYPKIVDSLFNKINYKVVLKNGTRSFQKPKGYIYLSGFSQSKKIKLGEVNIIPQKERSIPCVDNEEVVNCSFSSMFLIGKYTHLLEFRSDDDGKVVKEVGQTYAIPFSIVAFLSTLVVLTLKGKTIIFNLWKRAKS